ncbi:MAG: cupin domain-containing protein [Salinirussus sp.]
MKDIPEIKQEHLGLLQGFKIDLDALAGSHHHDKYEDESQRPDDPIPHVQTYAFQANEFDLGYVEADPGETIAWHNHAPALYQIYIPLEGRVRMTYIDSEGNERSGEGERGDLLYLPPGATNKMEVVGDETLKILAVERGVGVKRVDQILEEYADDEYDPFSDPDTALSIDTLRGEVRELNETAVEEY